MINHIYRVLKSNEQRESTDQTVQLKDNVIDAVVFMVRMSLIIGFVLGAMCMTVIGRIGN